MRDEKTRIAIATICLSFFIIVLLFRRIICYPFCSLETFSGKIGKGKSSYFIFFHLLASLFATIVCFVLTNESKFAEHLFQDPIYRIGYVFVLWMFWGLFIGWLIEKYLESTDEDFKTWKRHRTTK